MNKPIILVKSRLTGKIYLCHNYETCKSTDKKISKSKRDVTNEFIELQGNKKAFAEFFNLDLDIDSDLFLDDIGRSVTYDQKDLYNYFLEFQEIPEGVQVTEADLLEAWREANKETGYNEYFNNQS